MIDLYAEAYEVCSTYPEFRQYVWKAQGGSLSEAGLYTEATKKHPVIFVPRRNVFLKDFYVTLVRGHAMLIGCYIMGLGDTDYLQDFSYTRSSCTVTWGGMTGYDPGHLDGQLTDDDKVNYRGSR